MDNVFSITGRRERQQEQDEAEQKKRILETLDFLKKGVEDGEIGGIFFITYAANGETTAHGLTCNDHVLAGEVYMSLDIAKADFINEVFPS